MLEVFPHRCSVAQSLLALQARGLERLDAQLLVLHALGRGDSERAWLVAHDTDMLSVGALQSLASLAQRRCSGEPLAYLTGHQEFYGLDLLVDARVLVPRPDTETLVRWALDVLSHHGAAPVMDLGTGSGAIALALKRARPDLEVHALDFSADALEVAVTNAQRLGLQVQFSQGAWLADVAARFDVIVSNPPYIGSEDEHLAALTYEPLQALTSGTDGLDAIRCIIEQAPAHLQPGGWLLLEHGYNQASAVRDLLAAAGLCGAQTRHDLSGLERCTGAQRPGHCV